MSLAVLFPGQASQEVGMGTALQEASATARSLYALADQVTGLPIGELCRSGSLAELTRTEVAQVAVVTSSLAVASLLREEMALPLPVVAAAGHSVGELAAMAWSEALTPKDTLRLVHRRGELMACASEQVDGTMVAILGLEPEQLESICARASAETGAWVQIANLNAPGQVVISGERQTVARAIEVAQATGAQRTVPLKVAGPFHSRYMESAAEEFRSLCLRAAISAPQVPVVLNTTAAPSRDPEALRQELSDQITRPVRWADSLRTLARLGCTTFIEVGPGRVLTNLVRRTLPEARALAVAGPADLPSVAQLLAED